MTGQIDTCRHDSVTKPKRIALIPYARGHVVAAASASASLTFGRLGMTAPANTINGPTAERPNTGPTDQGARGLDHGDREGDGDLEHHAEAEQRARGDDVVALQCDDARAIRTANSATSLLIGSSRSGAICGCASCNGKMAITVTTKAAASPVRRCAPSSSSSCGRGTVAMRVMIHVMRVADTTGVAKSFVAGTNSIDTMRLDDGALDLVLALWWVAGRDAGARDRRRPPAAPPETRAEALKRAREEKQIRHALQAKRARARDAARRKARCAPARGARRHLIEVRQPRDGQRIRVWSRIPPSPPVRSGGSGYGVGGGIAQEILGRRRTIRPARSRRRTVGRWAPTPADRTTLRRISSVWARQHVEAMTRTFSSRTRSSAGASGSSRRQWSPFGGGLEYLQARARSRAEQRAFRQSRRGSTIRRHRGCSARATSFAPARFSMSITGSRRTRGAADGTGSRPATLPTNRTRSRSIASMSTSVSTRASSQSAGCSPFDCLCRLPNPPRRARAVLPDADAGWARFSARLSRLSVPRPARHSDATRNTAGRSGRVSTPRCFMTQARSRCADPTSTSRGSKTPTASAFDSTHDNGTILRIDAGFGSRDGKHLYIVFGDVF